MEPKLKTMGTHQGIRWMSILLTCLFLFGLSADRAYSQTAMKASDQKALFKWLKGLDTDHFKKKRFGDINEAKDVERIVGIRLGGHRKSDGKHMHYTVKELKVLLKLPGLKKLDLGEAEFPPAGLKEVAKCKTITFLSFGDGLISDKTLKGLQSLSNIEVLSICYPKDWNKPKSPYVVSDGSCQTALAMKKLRVLDISGTRVTDKGLALLAKHPALEEIHLGSSKVTDKGLLALAKIKTLKLVKVGKLQNIAVTSEGIKAFKAAHGKCAVTEKWSPLPGGLPKGKSVELK